MNFRSLLSFAVFVLLFAVSVDSYAQTGGRKREHRNQRAGGRGKLFSFKKSSGHADAFAKGGRKQGFISRIFKGNKSGSAWVYKKTNPGTKQNREQRQLFTRNRTKGKRYTDQVIAQQNRRRDATRVRGNQSFSKRKR